LSQKGAERGIQISNEILKVLNDGAEKTEYLVSKIASKNIKNFMVKAELLRLERLGLLQRKVLDEGDPLNFSSWSLTDKGRKMLRTATQTTQPYISIVAKSEIEMTQAKVQDELRTVRIVTTCPHEFRGQFHQLDAQDSTEVLRQLFSESVSEVKIVTPYLDNVIIDRFEKELEKMSRKGVKLKLIFRDYNLQTQNAIHALKQIFEGNFAWRRVSTPVTEGMRGQSARGIHAKFILIDKKIVLVSSMNLTVNSMNYNIEIGVLLSITSVVEQIDEIFNILWVSSKVDRD
jgi:phosphatidylserine/phosphatidylglycerophosphate/cardiolipin synthase-like enzyme